MKYSVIMPVYGVEKYLDESIKSVLAQTLTDFELILVDDCSPDRCPGMCDEWAKKDPRVRVIHKERNGGLGFARNTGLDAAKGRYVLFVDSDDRLLPETLAVCEREMNTDTDILVFGMKREYEDAAGDPIRTEVLSPEAFVSADKTGAAEAFLRLNRAHCFPFAWNKLYSRSFLNNAALRFESTPLIEDFLFNIAAFDKTDAIKLIPDPLYRYRKPAHETLVSRYHPQFFDLCCRKYALERAFLVSHDALNEETESFIAEAHLKHVVSVIIRNRNKKAKLSLARQLKKIKEMLRAAPTAEALQACRTADTKLKITAFCMRRGWALACLLIGVAAGNQR